MSVSVASSSECFPFTLRSSHRDRATGTRVVEVFTVEDSLPHFKHMTGKECPSLSLLCTIPTWSSSPVHCLDLHDLQDLRNRFMVFVHELLQSLRASGIQTTYRLIPSHMDFATIQISTTGRSKQGVAVDHDLLAAAQATETRKTLLAKTKQGPVIIMT